MTDQSSYVVYETTFRLNPEVEFTYGKLLTFRKMIAEKGDRVRYSLLDDDKKYLFSCSTKEDVKKFIKVISDNL